MFRCHFLSNTLVGKIIKKKCILFCNLELYLKHYESCCFKYSIIRTSADDVCFYLSNTLQFKFHTKYFVLKKKELCSK